MPTAAKLVAAVFLAALAYGVSELIKTQMPASTAFGVFSQVNAVIGFVCGWAIVGNRAGRGMSAAVSNGFTGTVAMVFWCLFAQAVYEMVQESMKHRYDGVVEAFAAIFELCIKLGENLVNGPVLLSLLIGAIVTGWVSEIASRHWR
ncbi:TrgA family protein [uncultured Pelagimonas sp.]|uniref:TrgA family protein n=1 Tax=uncultured Pelagimonas sp. TaxID=1618102 RepID=UPI0026233337|nr:TrgA family protein [uncultured Pelagimonas sp.]